MTEVTSPDGTAKVSFGASSTSGLRVSARRLLSTLEREYADVVVAVTRRGRVNGLPARLARGKATNDFGVRLSFRALIVRASDGTFFVLGFDGARGSDDLRPAAIQVMSSFRPTPGGSGSLSLNPPLRTGGGA